MKMEELVKRAKRGDPSAFAELIRLCTQSMYRVAWALSLIHISEPTRP